MVDVTHDSEWANSIVGAIGDAILAGRVQS